MVFLDANVPMYLVGRDHPLKSAAAGGIQRLSLAREKLVTDAEVFQEILHRYVSINRPEAIQPAFDALSQLVVEIFPIDMSTVHDARALALGYPGLSARDAIHIAVMKRHGIPRLFSFDEGYDVVPGINRITAL